MLLSAVALLLSALLGWPARTVRSEIVVHAPKPSVWAILVDFEAYDEWNPLYTRAEGEPREGTELALRVEVPGDVPEDLNAELVIVRPDHKLRWQARTLVPGLGDAEYEVRLEPLEGGGTRVIQEQRFEGPLSTFAQVDANQAALTQVSQALQARVETKEPGTTIYADTVWNCTQPLENYGELPITVKSRIDNASAQPDNVEAVWLSGPDCAGDGDPETIDLILEIEGDGAGIGPSGDAVKLRGGPHDIEVTGYANCGAPGAEGLQDGVHAMLGYRIRFVDFVIGNPAEERPTCAGVGFFVEERSAKDPRPKDVLCIRCTIVVKSRGLVVGDSIRSGARSSQMIAELESVVDKAAVDPINEHNRWTRLGKARADLPSAYWGRRVSTATGAGSSAPS